METALLLGVPQGYGGRIESAVAQNAASFSGWTLKFVHAPKSVPEITAGTIKQACSFADRYESPHILGFSTQQNRQILADQIRPYFRFRWFDHMLLRHVGSTEPARFVERLAADLKEEEEWAARVKPRDIQSPLLLPECSFEAGKKHRDMWRHATAYGDINNVVAGEKAVRAFNNSYRQKVDVKYKWVDDRNRAYDEDGPRHGQPPFPRGWKYSFRLVIGFHFDVSHAEKREFSIYDAEGVRHSAVQGGHVNIDPHGFVI